MPDAMILNNPIAVIGDEDMVLGFKALGFKIYPVRNSQECKVALNEAMRENTRVCLIEGQLYKAIEDIIAAYRTTATSIVIPFSKDKTTDVLDGVVKGIRLRATGAV